MNLLDGVMDADSNGCREDEGHGPGQLAQDGWYENLQFCHLDLLVVELTRCMIRQQRPQKYALPAEQVLL